MIFFTSDNHYSHANIIRYANRPFKNAREMDQEMIRRWNSVVEDEDIVYHLGDVAFSSPGRLREILHQLKGSIHLIVGNHDRAALKVSHHFQSLQSMLEIRIPDEDAAQGSQLIVLSHYAMRTWNKKHWGSWHLYGHSHGALPPFGKSFDVGVDCWDFTHLVPAGEGENGSVGRGSKIF